jgi:hypothetical protein
VTLGLGDALYNDSWSVTLTGALITSSENVRIEDAVWRDPKSGLAFFGTDIQEGVTIKKYHLF